MEITRRKFTVLTGAATALQALPGKSFALPAATGGNPELASLTLAEAAARLRARQVTSVELTQACLERIEIYNPKLDSFITVTRQRALAEARQQLARIERIDLPVTKANAAQQQRMLQTGQRASHLVDPSKLK